MNNTYTMNSFDPVYINIHNLEANSANSANINNLLVYSNNYINYLNNSVIYLNNSITYLNNLVNTINVQQQQNQQQQQNHQQQQNQQQNQHNAYLLNYTFADFEKLSVANLNAIINTNCEDIYYEYISSPNNDTCAITQETFTNNDKVTILKSCGHVFNSCAIKKWLMQHQTCPNCRYNILTNSNIISYLNPDNNKIVFLYSNEFKFFLALHIESLLTNNVSENNGTENNGTENNSGYDIGLIIR